MKKISRKLLTSSLTMAFAAVALGTTTFAWFTTNSTATATTTVGVQSSTENLMFSLAPTDGAYSWKTSVSFDFSTTALEPATYSSSKLVKKDGTTEAASGTNYVQAQFFVRCSPSATINFGECSVTSSNVKSYSMLAGANDDSQHSYAQGESVKAAAGNALRMVADSAVQTDAKENVWTKGENDAVIETLGTTVYSLGEDKTTESDVVNFGNSMTSSAFANRYYDAVAGNTQGTTKPNEGDTVPYTVETITKNTTKLFDAGTVSEGYNYKVYAVCLTFWLEGYDADCFDAILGQSMSIVVNLTTESTN